mmetsp:Transcript_18668/g.22789  ORF Transcript_18668/g.22789 Transcript_18668/m.22789 type:complete len:80 (-) Transcript_18668:1985-2224(-)
MQLQQQPEYFNLQLPGRYSNIIYHMYNVLYHLSTHCIANTRKQAKKKMALRKCLCYFEKSVANHIALLPSGNGHFSLGS